MAQRTTLTEKQVLILRWIADGCPDGVTEGESHRISAAALRGRGLVITSGRGPTWAAKITDTGREYLARVDGPEPPPPRQPNVSVTQQLVDDVIAAGGTLQVPRKNWYDRDSVDYESRARLAERYRKVPAGKRLVVSPNDEALEIKLVDAPDRLKLPELAPVAVPERIARYHRAAREFRDRRERQEVSRDQLKRATRIIHTVAVEAEHRGWSVEVPSESEDGHGRKSWTGAKNGHLHVSVEDHELRLRFHEDGVHTRGRWEDEVERYRRVGSLSWYRDRELPSGPFDAEATGQLTLELFFDQWTFSGRQSRWSDRQSWRLEERLPHLFLEIEERIIEARRLAEERRIAAEKAAEEAKRKAEERERQWHVLMDRARERFVAAHRAQHLRKQSDAWHDAQRLRRYCDALEAAYGERVATAEWLAWARSYATGLDPLTEPPTTPEPGEPTTDDLQEHLPDGWSAGGPDHSHHPRRRSSSAWPQG